MNLSTPHTTRSIDLPTLTMFLAIHFCALGAFFLPFHWYLPVLAAVLYVVRMFAITAGFHRYFAHRAFKTSRWFQFILAWLGTMSTQKGVLWWAAHHRDHHKYADQPEDLHSPLQHGMLWAQTGWFLASEHQPTKFDRIRDFAAYPELRWLNSWHYFPSFVMGAVLFLIGGWPFLIWGYFVSTVVLFHGTFSINSLGHTWGSIRYKGDETSRNNLFLAIITLGEGWHNNHHHYMSSANQGFFWWEIDISYYTLKALSGLRIVWDLRLPPESILHATEIPSSNVIADAVALPSPARTRTRTQSIPHLVAAVVTND